VFHIDVEDEKLVGRVGVKAQQLAEKVGETGFTGGLIVGLALALGWITINRQL
jgi:hypothetical protein